MIHTSQVAGGKGRKKMPDMSLETDGDYVLSDQALNANTTTTANAVDRQGQPSVQDWDDAATRQAISEAVGDAGGNQLASRIWVPAHKHPQIDPGEFAQWIKTHGLGITDGRSSGLRRQRSTLSVSYTSEYSLSDDEEDDDDEVLPISPTDSHAAMPFFKAAGLGRHGSLERGAFSHALDDHTPITPPTRPEKRSLLRRQALSARGKDRRQATKTAPVKSLDNHFEKVPPEGVSLYDHPVVSLSEWIDLGNASVEVNPSEPIFTRAHEAGTQVVSQLSADDNFKENVSPSNLPPLDALTPQSSPPINTTTASSITPTSSASSLSSFSSSCQSLPSHQSVTPLEPKRSKRRSLGRSLSERFTNKSERGSIFDHFFGSDKKRRATPTPPIDNERKQKTGLQLMLSKKSNLAGFLSRQFTMRPLNFGTYTNKASAKGTLVVSSSPQPNQRVGRAVYWLSHTKLSNPRRPLRHQVLISNFMFWYLSAIQANPQNEPSAHSSIPVSPSPPAASPTPPARTLSKNDQHGNKYKPVVNTEYQHNVNPPPTSRENFVNYNTD